MAATLGATAPLAYVLCAVAMGLIVLCIAEAGSRVAMTGGPYAYVEVAFGPFVGFLAGFLLWMLLTFAMAAVATVLVASLGALVPVLSSRGASAAALVLYAAFAAINILGVERGARVNSALTVAKVLPLLLLIVGGLFAIDPANLAIGDPPDLPRLARSSLLLIFAFAGVEAALVPGGEVKDPARTVPRAHLHRDGQSSRCSTPGLQFVAQGVLGPALATSKAAPLAEAAGVALGGWARTLILVGADRLDDRPRRRE